MEFDPLFLFITGAILAWMFVRKRRRDLADPAKRAERERRRAEAAAARAEREAKTMPRLGAPGTITPEQMEALRRYMFQPDRSWSSDEAALILDSVDYLRLVSESVTGERFPPIDIQNKLLTFILTDRDVRDHVRAWGRGRAERTAGEEAEIPRNRQYDKVAGYVGTLWTPDEDGEPEAGRRK